MAWLSGWNKRVKLTLDSSQVDAALSDFPVLIHLSTSSGVGSDDISFIFDELSSDTNRKKIAVTTSDGTTECYVEIERWDHANEQAWLHVKVPSISDTVDTELYLYFDADHSDNTSYVGNTGDTPAQSVWDSNFVGVWHMAQDPNGDVEDVVMDSTSNFNRGTPSGSMTTADLIDSKVGKAIDFDGVDDAVSCLNESNFDFATESFTVEACFRSHNLATGNYEIVSKRDQDANSGWFLRADGTAALTMWIYDGAYKNASTGDGVLSQDVWYYAAGLYDASADTINLDLNTTTYGPTSSVGSPTVNNYALNFGRTANGTAEWFDGDIDEVRISNIVRSAAWRKATYYSLWDSLITFGNQEINQEINIECEPLIESASLSGSPQYLVLSPALSLASTLGISSIFLGPFISCDPVIASTSLSSNIHMTVALPALALEASIYVVPQLQLPMSVFELTTSLHLTKVWDGSAWKAWVEQYGKQTAKYYYFTLTGSNESPPLADLTIPMSSFQARRKSGHPTFLSVVIPGSTYQSQIEARSNGEMVIEMAYELNGVIEYQEEIIRADYEEMRVDEGGRNQSIIMTGHKTETFVGKVTWLQDVVYRRDDDGDLAFRCASCDLYFNPGDTARYGSDSFTVNQVILSISPDLQVMEVEESAT